MVAVCAVAQVWRSEGNLQELVLPFHVSPKDQTRVF